MAKSEKQLCLGTEPVEIKARPFGLSGQWGKCGLCQRILVLKADGTLRQHQARNKNTASLDSTRDILWENHGAR